MCRLECDLVLGLAALGVDDGEGTAPLSESDRRMGKALSALYGDGEPEKKGRGGLGQSAPRVAKWLGDIRDFFPAPVVQVIQKDAFERKGLRLSVHCPEVTVTSDVVLLQRILQNLLAEGISIRDIPTILEGIAEAAPLTSNPRKPMPRSASLTKSLRSPTSSPRTPKS